MNASERAWGKDLGAAASKSVTVLAIFFATDSSLAADSPSSFFASARRARSSAIFSWIWWATLSDWLKFSWAIPASRSRPLAAIAICSAEEVTVTASACSARWRLSRASSCQRT